jgi:hypothetical protein
MQELQYRICSEGFLRVRVTIRVCAKFCILIWTYYVFRLDDMKVVIMCNGKRALSIGSLETFLLLLPVKYNLSEWS